MNKIFLSIFILTVLLQAQNKFNFSLNGSYTTSAKIYLSPNASDPEIRNRSFPLSSFFSQGMELRCFLTDNINVSFNIEYLTSKETGRNLVVFSNNSAVEIDVEDGFNLIPLELSIYYLLPFSSEGFKLYMGGGIGYYYGEMIRSFGDISVSTVNRKLSYGIHATVSADFLINNFFGIRGELKFRDPQFTVTSEYNKQSTNFNGNDILIGQKTFDSKINVDGVTFTFGLVYYFSL